MHSTVIGGMTAFLQRKEYRLLMAGGVYLNPGEDYLIGNGHFAFLPDPPNPIGTPNIPNDPMDLVSNRWGSMVWEPTIDNL